MMKRKEKDLAERGRFGPSNQPTRAELAVVVIFLTLEAGR
jgi:hypothetical protein